MCLDCARLRPRVENAPMRCDAFPAGIPRAILFEQFDHCAPYPGDGGILFEPDPEAPIWRARCRDRVHPGPLVEDDDPTG
jgi:hypothetical protein